MAGIYIHIPFCRKRCHYCNFFSLATKKFRNEFHQALLQEIELTRGYLRNEPVETIYFGGGTPSVLETGQIQEILDKIRETGSMSLRGAERRSNGISPSPSPSPQGEGRKSPLGDLGVLARIQDPGSPEITIELNPDDVDPAYLEGLAATGINRLSLGIQSFFDEDLQYLGRSHTGKQAKEALDWIREAGYGLKDDGRRTRDEGRGTKDDKNDPASQKRKTKSEPRKAKNEKRTASVDLIYGIPSLSNDRWKDNLLRVIDKGIPHLSAYALTVEEKTPLAWMIRRHPNPSPMGMYPTPNPSSDCFSRVLGIATRGEESKSSSELVPRTREDLGARSGSVMARSRATNQRHPVSDDQAAEQFGILMDVMEQAGYIQYEISNFSLPGYESVHNSHYWTGIPYLGLGPSAHSFDGSSRRWNPSHLTSYIHHLNSGNLLFEEERLSLTQQYNEYVMTSLRTVWGCAAEVIQTRFGREFTDYFMHQAIRHLASGHLQETNGVYTLTREGKFFADGVAADLFRGE